MPPYAILLCAVATVLATLTVSPAPADVRTVVVAADAAFVLFLFSRHCRPARFRELLLVTLAVATLNAGIRTHSDAEIVRGRTARYTATLLDRVEQPDGTSEVTLALDNGATAAARVREDVPSGARVLVRGRLEPFDEARNPGEPSERAIEAERGVDGRLEGATILAIDRNATGDARTWLARAHAWAHEQLRRRLGEPAASVGVGRVVGRARRDTAGAARRVPGDGNGARSRDRRSTLRRGHGARDVASWRAGDAAGVDVRRRDRHRLALRLVERRAAAGSARRDDGDGGTGGARLRTRDLFVERAGDCRAGHCLRAAVERCVGVVRALVLVRRRNLCLCGAFRALARRRRCDTRSATRGARPFRRDATGNVAARGGGLSAVRALCGRGKLRRGSLRSVDHGAGGSAACVCRGAIR